jgi:class 3 adenylate cyclase/CHASE2 domain-containing sensor protein
LKIRIKKQRIWKPRLFRLGLYLTLLVILADWAQSLNWFENFLYDRRARYCQRFMPPPSDRIFHIDIDDDSLNEIGAWPWPRAQLAQIMDEIALAKPKVIGMDMYFPEAQGTEGRAGPDGKVELIPNDERFAQSLKRAGNVLVPISIRFASAGAPDPMYVKVKKFLQTDLELTEDQVIEKLRQEGISGDTLPRDVRRVITFARQDAMLDRLVREVQNGTTDPAELRKKLVPRAEQASVRTDARFLFDAKYPVAMAIQEMSRFRFPLERGAKVANAPSEISVNILPIAQAARYSGFVDMLPSASDGTVRTVPLLVNYRGEALPHMALSMACALLDVDFKSIKYNGNSITLPVPGRDPIVIPTRIERSTTLGTVGALIDVPYFGPAGNDWLTMYDFPNYRAPAAHMRIGKFWNNLLLVQSIQKNNRTADQILKDLSDRGVSAPELDKYLESPPDPADSKARTAIVNIVMKTLSDVGLGDLTTKPEAELDADSRALAERLKSLKQALADRDESAVLLDKERLALKTQLQGKAIFVNWTAEGRGDYYPTSLHPLCPGAVIQSSIVNGILTREMWWRLPQWVTALITLAVGMLTTLLVALLPPWRALICTMGVQLAYLMVNGELLFDYRNMIVGTAGPVTACGLVWGGLTLINLITEARERARTRKRLVSYIDPAIVNFFEDHPELDSAAGQRREMTVAFTDLAGFTTISEKLGESTVNLLNEFFGKMVPVIREHRGVVNKFLGDGLMFFFNAPDDNPNHAADAVQSVLEMRKVLLAFNSVLKDRGLPPIGMRAGMTTGPMIVGDAGSKSEDEKNNSNDYTVLGDKVNLAARLEGANKVFGSNLMMNQETRDAIGNRFLCRKIGKIQVKGKSEYVMCHEAICSMTEATAEQTAHATLSSKIVDTFQAGEFDPCLALCDDLESQFKDSDFAEAYRDECAKHLEKTFKGDFAGQIVLREK